MPRVAGWQRRYDGSWAAEAYPSPESSSGSGGHFTGFLQVFVGSGVGGWTVVGSGSGVGRGGGPLLTNSVIVWPW